jgi:ATP-dependent protease ClpP protease subunit
MAAALGLAHAWVMPACAQDQTVAPEPAPAEEAVRADDAVLAMEEGPCAIWHHAENGQPFLPDVMEIRVNGDVGPIMEDSLIGTLNHHLSTYPSLNTIKILLSSAGGYIESGFKIHNYLHGLHERHRIQVVIHNTSSVQSSAVDIYCGASQRVASPYSFFMVHDTSRELEGSYDVKAVKDLEEENRLGSVASHAIFSGCTSVPIAKVDQMFAEQTYLDAEQALALGLVHSIQPATYDRAADIRCLIDADESEGEP